MRPINHLKALALGAFVALGLALPAAAQTPLSINEKYRCVYAVTPSSGVAAIQFNTNARLAANGSCVSYKEVCVTLEDTNTQVVYLSTFSTTNAAFGWPIYGTSTMCRDWTERIPIFYFFKSGLTPIANTLKFDLSSR